MRLLLLPALAVLAACAYDPPVQGDRSSSNYQRSLKACQTSAEKAQGQREGTPGAMIVDLFDFGKTTRHDVQTCMQARGYALR